MTDILTDVIADQMADDGVLLPEDQWDPAGAYDYCPTDDSTGAELGALATIFGGAIVVKTRKQTSPWRLQSSSTIEFQTRDKLVTVFDSEWLNWLPRIRP